MTTHPASLPPTTNHHDTPHTTITATITITTTTTITTSTTTTTTTATTAITTTTTTPTTPTTITTTYHSHNHNHHLCARGQYDPRTTTDANTIVVSDRRNMRFEFFHYNPSAPDTFEYYKTADMASQLGPDTLPCNMRMTHGYKYHPEMGGVSVVPDLNGPVAVLDSNHKVRFAC
jgi:hypothetical protein